MGTAEIPREEWTKFFDDFSRLHEGWTVNVEVLSSELGDQPEVEGLPLVGIGADVKDRENSVHVIVGGKDGADLNRIINNPKTVRVKQAGAGGKHDAIEIEAEDGTTTVVQFRHISDVQADRQLPEGRARRKRDVA